MMPLIDENVPLIEKIDLDITWWEDERLRNMHLAAMRTTAKLFDMWDRHDVYYPDVKDFCMIQTGQIKISICTCRIL